MAEDNDHIETSGIKDLEKQIKMLGIHFLKQINISLLYAQKREQLNWETKKDASLPFPLYPSLGSSAIVGLEKHNTQININNSHKKIQHSHKITTRRKTQKQTFGRKKKMSIIFHGYEEDKYWKQYSSLN